MIFDFLPPPHRERWNPRPTREGHAIRNVIRVSQSPALLKTSRYLITKLPAYLEPGHYFLWEQHIWKGTLYTSTEKDSARSYKYCTVTSHLPKSRSNPGITKYGHDPSIRHSAWHRRRPHSLQHCLLILVRKSTSLCVSLLS